MHKIREEIPRRRRGNMRQWRAVCNKSLPPRGFFLVLKFKNVFKKYDGVVTVKWISVNEHTSTFHYLQNKKLMNLV
jgi:hypothetical protein